MCYNYVCFTDEGTGTEKLSNEAKVTQPERGKARFHHRNLALNPMFLTLALAFPGIFLLLFRCGISRMVASNPG